MLRSAGRASKPCVLLHVERRLRAARCQPPRLPPTFLTERAEGHRRSGGGGSGELGCSENGCAKKKGGGGQAWYSVSYECRINRVSSNYKKSMQSTSIPNRGKGLEH